MATIEPKTKKNGKKSFRARVRVSGFKAHSHTFDKFSDAKSWANQLEADMRLGRSLPEIAASQHTLGEAIARYLEEVEVSQQNQPRYFASKKSMLFWWKRQLGDYQLNLITASLISEHKIKLLKGGIKGKRSNSSVNRYLAALSATLNRCVKEWSWMHRNPLATVEKLKEPRGRVRYLSPDEIKRLLVACEQEQKLPLLLLVVLAISTGARRNELVCLEWENVDLVRGRATLYATKNGDIGTLHITGYALELLKAHFEVRSLRHQFVFGNSRTGKPYEFERAWQRALKSSNIQDFRFHDLRHTAASYLAMSGGDAMSIKELLRHKSLKMVVRYTHLCDSHIQNSIATMNQKVFEGVAIESREMQP